MSLTLTKGLYFFMKNQEKANKNEQITINEIKPNLNFIIVYETIYKNNDLTSEEIHLLIKLIAKAPNFKPTSDKLADILHMSKKTLNKASKSLQEKGYLTIKKYGNKSEWNITQTPILNTINILSVENLVNGLLNYTITPKELKLMHKLKRIDDKIYIETIKQYSKELQRILKTNWLNDD